MGKECVVLKICHHFVNEKKTFIFFKPSGGKMCCTTTECVAVVVLYNLMNGFL